VTPYITVFHFDYPQALERRGGWLNPDSSAWFAEYAGLLSSRLSDRVTHWLTINEPNIFWALGNEAGAMPPALHRPDAELLTGANNLLLAHGKAVQALRAMAKQPIQVSLPFAGILKLPATTGAADAQAARTASFTVEKNRLAPEMPGVAFLSASWWLDPIYLGHYPEQGLRFFGAAAKGLKASDLETIHQPLDFLAINLYTASRVKAGADGRPQAVPDAPDVQRTTYGWAVTPDLLYWGPKFLYERYGKPIAITENGSAWVDVVTADGKVHDAERLRTLNDYLRNYLRASAEGVPLKGYFYWSLLDNWEFMQGYQQRFGLVHVDFDDRQKRVVKDSGFRYREIVTSNGGLLT
jgi:beta-glucosidase